MAVPVRKNILIVANKTWEAEPLCHVLMEKRALPQSLVPTRLGYSPQLWWDGAPRNTPPIARLTLACAFASSPKRKRVNDVVEHDADDGGPVLDDGVDTRRARIQVWCIEDWMEPASNSSSTFAKAAVLPAFFAEATKDFGAPPDAVIAFGTAGIDTHVASNGSVTIGTRCYVHDPFGTLPAAARVTSRADGRTDPMWTDPKGRMDTVLPSGLLSTFFRDVPGGARSSAEARMLAAPLGSASPCVVLAGNGFASISTVNVTNYDDYVWADPQTRREFRQRAAQNEIGSIETTHGVIRLAAEDALGSTPPFLYVSGVTDSLGLFDIEVAPRNYSQNFVAAHNAGIALAWLLPELLAAL